MEKIELKLLRKHQISKMNSKEISNIQNELSIKYPKWTQRKYQISKMNSKEISNIQRNGLKWQIRSIFSMLIGQNVWKYQLFLLFLVNSSHAVRDLGRVRQYPPWLLFAAFVESVGCPRYNPQKTRKQWHTRDRRFHWLWGWFPDLKIIFMM